MAQYVKLGPNANFFRASGIDVSVSPGEVVALNAKQMSNRLIRRAINGGHLILTEKPGTKKAEEPTELTPDQLNESFLEMVNNGDTEKKLLSNFSLKDLTDIASVHGIEVEEGDTKKTILKAILEEVNGSNE